MGVPGDEDGGGLSGFVVFSMMGLYPVTPGMPVYNLSSPFFEEITINLAGNKQWRIHAVSASQGNKYIQQATVNYRSWNRPWVDHQTVIRGGDITFGLGKKHSTWGGNAADAPPSAQPMP